MSKLRTKASDCMRSMAGAEEFCLGVMGGPMAANLARAGFDVAGFNRSPAKAQALAACGGRAADSIAAAVRHADVAATMLPDSPDVLDVVLGDDGVLANLPEGGLLIDFSTIRPVAGEQLKEALAEPGALRGEDEVPGAAVGRVGAALDEALFLDLVGDEGGVRGLAAHALGKFAHGHRPGHLPQRGRLGAGEAQSHRALAYVIGDLPGQPVHQAAQLPLGGCARFRG